MQTNLSALRGAVEAAFRSKCAAGLFELLGFESRGMLAPGLGAALPGIDRCYAHGSRGTLSAYCFQTKLQLTPAELVRAANAARAFNQAQLQLYICVDDDFTQIVIATFGLGEQLLTLMLRRGHIHAADLEALAELTPEGDEKGSALAARHGHALDRGRVTRRFFSDFAAQRDLVALGWSGIPEQKRRDRDQLALLLLSRLMFLYFLQHRGYLAGDRRYLEKRFHRWQSQQRAGRSFFCADIKPLFFSVLNRRPERRPARAHAFGDLPYLNGGLFERHLLERRYARLDLRDERIASVLEDLFARYRFTAHEASDAALHGVQDVGVDAEMLGRVFEGLMAARTRATTGTFYTPAETVDRLVCDALTALLAPRIGEPASRELIRVGNINALDTYQRQFTARLLRETRVLDPACGSGAFLLGSLARMARARAALEPCEVMSARRELVAKNLYGVDLQSDAALLCALRLWLALVPGGSARGVQPLPNLERQIRQGDSLVDPIDLKSGAGDAEIRRHVAALQPATRQYVSAEPERRAALQRALAVAERGLARAWIGRLRRRIQYQQDEQRALAQQKDLFGQRTSEARAADDELSVLADRAAELKQLARAVRGRNEHPFFSYGVHFADAALSGFDLIVCNPPWVRAHNWNGALSAVARGRFQVCRTNAWKPPHDGELCTAGGNQVDLALLFLERAIDLLAPGGVLGIILPAKFMRSLSGASARKLLLRHTEIVSIEDHSLDQRSIFQADAFASLVVARKTVGPAATVVRVTQIARGREPLQFAMAQRDLSLVAGDDAAPWLLVPPPVRRAIARMRTGMMLGAQRDLHLRRGIVTGANDVLVLSQAQPKLGELRAIRSQGYAHAANPADYEGVIEQSAVARLVRGSDVRAWVHECERHLIRRPNDGARITRTLKYLARHNCELPAWHAPALPLLAWHDLASTLNAVVLPTGTVPLNTVYFMALPDDLAHLLCAYFNSLPVRVYARAIAERAKDAHFRFFAWTVSLLPLPAAWRSFEAEQLRAISRAAHATHGIAEAAQSELDAIVARAYGLSRADMRALADYDRWLRSP